MSNQLTMNTEPMLSFCTMTRQSFEYITNHLKLNWEKLDIKFGEVSFLNTQKMLTKASNIAYIQSLMYVKAILSTGAFACNIYENF